MRQSYGVDIIGIHVHVYAQALPNMDRGIHIHYFIHVHVDSSNFEPLSWLGGAGEICIYGHPCDMGTPRFNINTEMSTTESPFH